MGTSNNFLPWRPIQSALRCWRVWHCVVAGVAVYAHKARVESNKGVTRVWSTIHTTKEKQLQQGGLNNFWNFENLEVLWHERGVECTTGTSGRLRGTILSKFIPRNAHVFFKCDGLSEVKNRLHNVGHKQLQPEGHRFYSLDRQSVLDPMETQYGSRL